MECQARTWSITVYDRRTAPRETPTGEKNRDAGREQARIGPEWTSGDHIHEQDPHPEDLSESADVIDGLRHAFPALAPTRELR